MAKPQQAGAAPSEKKTVKKRTVKVDAVGQAHVNATFNNIIITSLQLMK